MILNETLLGDAHTNLKKVITALADSVEKSLGANVLIERCAPGANEVKALEAQGRLPLKDVNRLRRIAGMAEISSPENTLLIPECSDQYVPEKGKAQALDVLLIPAGKNKGMAWEAVRKTWAEATKEAIGDLPVVWGGQEYPGHFRIKTKK